MPKPIRSARGEMVNFDLLKIKAQMANAPKPIQVTARIDFVESRLRRKASRTAAEKVSQIDVAPKDVVDPELVRDMIGIQPGNEGDDDAEDGINEPDVSSQRTTVRRKSKGT